MSDYRRFVSYIYAYKYGKKEKNTGFAKVEARNGNLKISIQLENAQDGQGRLDAYGFVRKGEKLYGIPLGELTLSPHPSLRVLTSSANVAGSGYPLRSLAGLWLKGNQGENHITIWDDEPIARMDLEVEIKTSASPDPSAAEEAMETTTPVVHVVEEQQEKTPVSTVTKSSEEVMASPSLGEEIPWEEVQSVPPVPEPLVEVIASSEPEKAMLGTTQSVSSVDEMSAKIFTAVNAEPIDEPDLSPTYSEKLRSESAPSVADDTEMGVKTTSSIGVDTEVGVKTASSIGVDTEVKIAPSINEDTEVEVKSSSSIREDTKMEVKSSSSIREDTEVEVKSSPSISEDTEMEVKSSPSISDDTEMELESSPSISVDTEAGVKTASSIGVDTELREELSSSIAPNANAEGRAEPSSSIVANNGLRSEEAISAAGTEPKLRPSVFSSAASASDQAFPVGAEPKVISSATILPEQKNSASAVSNHSVWNTTLAEQIPNGGKNINGVRAQEAASMTVARPQCFKARQPQHTSNQYASENEKIWNSLSRTYPHLNPFPEEEALDCVRISPRELHLFRRQGWNAPKNTFMLHGYYNFRHLIFGQFPNGGYFLGVPGYYSPQEQRVAASFGFPIFKDGRNSRNTGRLGYWCRPL